MDESRRDRKKRQTRDRIQEAALDLFTAHGYRNTTIAAIAEHADVATRTVTLHFPTKEDLLFADDPFTPASLADRLTGRTKPALDVVREWMRDTMGSLDRHDADRCREPGEVWARRTRRAALIAEDDDLRGRARAAYRDLELLIAAAIGEDVDLPADAMAPRLTAYALIGGLRELYTTREVRQDADLSPLVDQVFTFARAGLKRLT
ncbi:TetR/AcrR family transcriptional regulator [Actinophytocola algeriensis]|uniref:AcrR family transcriptional regulator n=1 Tax=Actinophytocola algeriensis TaxID=1768010 RepID=A0A7W7VIL6_9PSEU|nr:TetR/AcrR family transcriptional regulator [Actinophytocola algeriensis]MBB4911656.1 AcrR family transcriptional regulator [Actinophytocola algeriensis]MBE1473356.1 AcrR family transcriptional regulator [Actinophytocola algeriensis]